MAILFKDGGIVFDGGSIVFATSPADCRFCRTCWYRVRIRYVCEDSDGGDWEAPSIDDRRCEVKGDPAPGPTGWTEIEDPDEDCEFVFFKWVEKESCNGCEVDGDCDETDASALIDAGDRPAEPDCSDCDNTLYQLSDCEGNAGSIYTQSDLSAHVGSVVEIDGAADTCWSVSEVEDTGQSTEDVTVTASHADCDACLKE